MLVKSLLLIKYGWSLLSRAGRNWLFFFFFGNAKCQAQKPDLLNQSQHFNKIPQVMCIHIRV